MAVLSPSEIFNLDVDMAGMYRRAMDVQGRKSATRAVEKRRSSLLSPLLFLNVRVNCPIDFSLLFIRERSIANHANYT
jgi:hypothetical protein